MADESPIQGLMTRPRCCDQDYGGSHYHCARCNGVTGMYGHYRAVEFVAGRKPRQIEGHFCCPGDCEKPDAHQIKPSPPISDADRWDELKHSRGE